MLIFLLIVGVPFIVLLGSLFRPDLVEQMIREPSRRDASYPATIVERPVEHHQPE